MWSTSMFLHEKWEKSVKSPVTTYLFFTTGFSFPMFYWWIPVRSESKSITRPLTRAFENTHPTYAYNHMCVQTGWPHSRWNVRGRVWAHKYSVLSGKSPSWVKHENETETRTVQRRDKSGEKREKTATKSGEKNGNSWNALECVRGYQFSREVDSWSACFLMLGARVS